MARSAEYKIIPGPEVREWARKFGKLPDEMTRRAVPLFDTTLRMIFDETQALVHEYPQGAHYPPITAREPTLRDIARSGRLRESGRHLGAMRTGDHELVDTIGYFVDWAEFERTGTSGSIPPFRDHDFMAPWVPGMEYLGEGIDELWEEIWK
jgi:hypothetical protein